MYCDVYGVSWIVKILLGCWSLRAEYVCCVGRVFLFCLVNECCWYMIIRVRFWLFRWWINSKWVKDGRMDFGKKLEKCCAIYGFTVAVPLSDF